MYNKVTPCIITGAGVVSANIAIITWTVTVFATEKGTYATSCPVFHRAPTRNGTIRPSRPLSEESIN